MEYTKQNESTTREVVTLKKDHPLYEELSKNDRFTHQTSTGFVHYTRVYKT